MDPRPANERMRNCIYDTCLPRQTTGRTVWLHGRWAKMRMNIDERTVTHGFLAAPLTKNPSPTQHCICSGNHSEGLHQDSTVIAWLPWKTAGRFAGALVYVTRKGGVGMSTSLEWTRRTNTPGDRYVVDSVLCKSPGLWIRKTSGDPSNWFLLKTPEQLARGVHASASDLDSESEVEGGNRGGSGPGF